MAKIGLTKKWGAILLAVWLILTGLIYFVPKLGFDGMATIMNILALVAGIFILIDW